jgi:hypothetical protein
MLQIVAAIEGAVKTRLRGVFSELRSISLAFHDISNYPGELHLHLWPFQIVIIGCLYCKDVDTKITIQIEVSLENTGMAGRNKHH